MLGNIKIGNNVKIGAGSVVVHPVPDNATVVGVPGEILRREPRKTPTLTLDHGDLPDPIEEMKERIRLLQREVDTLEKQFRDPPKK